MENKILIVTGGLLSVKDKSLLTALKKEIKQLGTSKSAWLESKIKAVAAEPIITSKLERKSYTKKVKNYFSRADNYDVPELTEVVLMGLLEAEAIPYEAITFDTLFSNIKKVKQLQNECNVVFMSSTLLHDLSEMYPLIHMLKTPGNRIIVGGALAGSLCKYWEGMPEVDILAIGYGEMLVHSLTEWIKSDFKELTPPATGRIEQKKFSTFLYSGIPEGSNLDFLPTPNWKLAEKYHDRKYKMIHYESVRGCPYRCSFCNYPFLFDDKKFRTKSAAKIADDWEYYVKNMGVQYITCLDSLFTMPKKRLTELCNLLIERKINVKWICYARADDLVDEETVN